MSLNPRARVGHISQDAATRARAASQGTGCNVSITRRASVPPTRAWERLEATGEFTVLEAESGHLSGCHGFVVPFLNDSYLAVFCEGRQGALVTTTWILYGPARERAEGIREHWTRLLDRVLL